MKYLFALGFLMLAAPGVQAQSLLPAATNDMELVLTASAVQPVSEEAMSERIPLSALEADKRTRKARRQSGPEAPMGKLSRQRSSTNAPQTRNEKAPGDKAEEKKVRN